MPEQMTSAEAISLIEAAWGEWLAAIDSVPQARWTDAGVCGEWSIKDLLGHVAVWDALCVRYLERAARGEPVVPFDWEQLNLDEAAARAHRTIADQRAEMDASHALLLDALPAVTVFDPKVLGESSWEHYPEHTEQVIAWR